MKRVFFFGQGLFVTALLVTLLSSTGANAFGRQSRFEQMDAYFESRVHAASIPGGGYAIVEDGQIVHIAAFGVASLKDRRLLTVQTPMMVGSVGKTITALAIRQLANVGKIELSAPVTRYLPWFRLAAPGAAERITLQDLLDHKSGLSKNDGQDLPRVYRPGLTGEDVARGMLAVHLAHDPGTVEEYSNLNYILLGVVVEAVSGQNYGDYIQQHIFTPLGMRSSTTDIEAAKVAGLTDGHHYLFGFPVAYEEPFPSGVVAAGYHISSIEDMARFAAVFSNGGEYGGVSVIAPNGKPASKKQNLDIQWKPSAVFQTYDSFTQSGANLNANAAVEIMPVNRLGAVVMFNSNPVQFMDIPEGAADLSNDLLRMYLGIETLRPRSSSVRTVYLYLDLLLLAFAMITATHVLGLRKWPRRLEQSRSIRLYLGSLFVDAVLPPGILIGVPLLLDNLGVAPVGSAWPVFFRQLPDLSGTLLAVAFALLGTGIVKAFYVFTLKPGRGQERNPVLESL